MIKTDISNGIVHTYSDAKKPIRMKDTGWVAKNGQAFQNESDDKIHEWEEVVDD